MNADVTVRELMDREYVGVSESDDLVETVELLLQEDAEAAVVQRGGEHVGVVTERDVLSLLVDGPDPDEATVADAMTDSVPTVSPDATLDGAAGEMSTRSAGRLVVANGAEPLGVITEQDLLAARNYDAGAADVTEETPDSATVTARESNAGGTAEAEESYQEQSICEGCGALTSDLASFNGQLLCPDCRDI